MGFSKKIKTNNLYICLFICPVFNSKRFFGGLQKYIVYDSIKIKKIYFIKNLSNMYLLYEKDDYLIETGEFLIANLRNLFHYT